MRQRSHLFYGDTYIRENCSIILTSESYTKTMSRYRRNRVVMGYSQGATIERRASGRLPRDLSISAHDTRKNQPLTAFMGYLHLSSGHPLAPIPASFSVISAFVTLTCLVI